MLLNNNPILNNNGTIKAKYENYKLRVKFNRIEKTNVDVTYSLKISKKWDKSEDELNQTIAFTEYSTTVIQAYNPSGEGINMAIDNIELDQFSYLTVIAQIKDGPIIEYVAYDPIYKIIDSDDKSGISEEEESDIGPNKNKDSDNDDWDDDDDERDDDDDDDNKNLIIIVCSIGGVIFYSVSDLLIKI